MNKKELFESIQKLKPYIDAVINHTTIKVGVDDQELLKKVYTNILPGQRLNSACMECVKYAFLYCQSYYEREYPKYLESIKPVDIVEEPVKKSRKK